MLKSKIFSIVGLGLIGGSYAKALRKYIAPSKIFAVDTDVEVIKAAIAEKVIDGGSSDILDEKVLNSDVIVLATPVKSAIPCLEALAGKVKPGCIVTDLCSTKADLINCIETLPKAPIFVGGHPMAGHEKSGYFESYAELFVNATFLLTKSKTTDPKSFEILFNIVAGIGANPVELNAVEHDLVTGCISHLPHVIAFTLVNFVKSKDWENFLSQLAGGGFKDISRVASSDHKMWESIFLTNKDTICKLILEYIELLERFKNMIDQSETENMKNFMLEAKKYRDAIPDKKN